MLEELQLISIAEIEELLFRRMEMEEINDKAN